MKKRELGQFYTTNANYIIGNLVNDVPKNSTIVDPFAGNWDLLNLFNQRKVAYDVDPKNKLTIQRDSLLNPADYTGMWVVTNPPYLAKNKSKNKNVFTKYNTSDLYKASLLTMLNTDGGIVILPINFFSDEDNQLRQIFLSKFMIKSMNIFEESVFDDTDYTVCAFSFMRKETQTQHVNATVYPSKTKFEFSINYSDGYRIGAEFYKLLSLKTDINIGRMVSFKKNILIPSNMFIYAIDTGTNSGKIRLEYRDEIFYGINTDRAFATIGLSITLSRKDQLFIIDRFNTILTEYRSKYRSLFLTNYRNSTSSYSRKRIGFDTVYGLILYIIMHELRKEQTINE